MKDVIIADSIEVDGVTKEIPVYSMYVHTTIE